MTGSIGAVTDERLRTAAERLALESGLDLVVLFGSAAAPQASRAKDLDIGVLASRPVDTVFLSNKLIERLGVQEIDLVDLRLADALLLALVARDGIALYERNTGAFARFASLAARRFADTEKFRVAERESIRRFLLSGVREP